MKKEKTTATWFCDICERESKEELLVVSVPHWFMTEQTEGNPIKPYINKVPLHLCSECIEKVVVVKGWGAQGYNSYKFINGRDNS